MKTPYETMFLLPAATPDDQVDSFLARLKETIEKKSGDISLSQKMGIRKTAYPVNKENSAYYVLIQYSGSGETLFEVERLLKNSDEVLKYLSTKVTNKPLRRPPKVKKNAVVAAETPAAAETPVATEVTVERPAEGVAEAARE